MTPRREARRMWLRIPRWGVAIGVPLLGEPEREPVVPVHPGTERELTASRERVLTAEQVADLRGEAGK